MYRFQFCFNFCNIPMISKFEVPNLIRATLGLLHTWWILIKSFYTLIYYMNIYAIKYNPKHYPNIIL